MSTWTDTLTMDTMAKERANPPFDVRKMSIEHHGSENDLVKKEKFMLEASRDPVFYSADIYDLTKEQIRERTMQRIQRLAHYVTTESVDDFQKRMELMSLLDPGLWTRLGVHYGLFLGAIRSGATPNQFSYWMEKGVIGCKGMFGCFGMTELAHGSNVAGLETTAHFDAQTDEFVIHTPNLGATKWWIGGAAQTATHCSVFAQLIVKGKRYGTKTFIVPLRDPKSFQLLPGINIGDIGKKMGRDGIDNGYIQFTNVRIPRAYMLMKHTQVTRDGEVREPPLQQLTYGALLQGRTAMVADAANTAKKALTISVRYAAARRQFKSDAKAELETQILDYPIHQRRLMPLLAQAVAFGYTALELQRLFEETSQALEALEPGDPNLDATIEKLKETHSTSAGLKAFCTWATLETIDRSRQACGGHGYSSYNGFANMYSDFAVHCLIKGTKVLVIRNSQLARVHVEELRTGDALLDEHGRVTRIHTPVLPVKAQTRAVTGQAQGHQVMAYEVTPGHLLSLRCDCTPYQIHTSPQLRTARMQWASRNDAGQIEWRWANFALHADGELVKADESSERPAAALGPATAFTHTVHGPVATYTASASSKSVPTEQASSAQPQLLDTPPASPSFQPQLLDSPPASPKIERASLESVAETQQTSDRIHSQEEAVESSTYLALDAELKAKCAAWFQLQPDRVQVGVVVDISADAYAELDASHPLKSIFGGFRGSVADTWPEELANAAVPAALRAHYELVDPYFLGFWLGSGSHVDAKVYTAACQTQVIDRLREILEPQGFELREEAEVADGNWRVSITDGMPLRAHSNRLLDALDAFGLTGEQGTNKHIPPAFLYGSADVRRRVLAGLLDSDGCLPVVSEPHGDDIHVWQFVQSEIHDRLFDDVLDLARSLGLAHTRNPERFHKDDGSVYRSIRLAGPGQELVSAQMRVPTKRLSAFEEVSEGQRKCVQLVVERKSPSGPDNAVDTFYSFQVDGNTKRFLLADWTTVHNCTWEGDNTILALQSGRFLISAYQDALDGKKQVSAGTIYLNDLDKVLSAKCESNEALDTLEGIDRGWATVAAHAVKKASEDYQACLKAGRSREQAFEDCSQVRFVAASVHTSGYIFRQFRSAVERVEKSDDGVREHLELLAKFYGLWQMEEKAAFFLRSGWLTPAQLDYASAKVTEYCAKTRSFAIPLIDSFAISDHVLNSPIGRYDGDIYREYFRMVRRNNPQLKEHPYFERLIRPFIERETPELEDFDEAIGIDDEIEEIKQDREEAEAEAKAQAEENKK